MGILNYIVIPNNVGPDQYDGFLNSNIKVGMVADFILNNYSLAVLISDNNPPSSVVREINIKVGKFTIRIKGYNHYSGYPSGAAVMYLINDISNNISSYIIVSGTMSIFFNPDVFVLVAHQYLNAPFILLRNGTFNYYNSMSDFNNIPRNVNLLSGGYTSKTPNGKFRILQPSFPEEGDYISPYIYSITNTQLQMLTVSETSVTYLSDENNNIWCTFKNLLFK